MAFQQLKEYLSWPPIMSKPVVDKVLFAYLAVAFYAISFVLIRVDNGVQRLVYYVSKSLNEAEVRYLPLKKAILAVVHARRKLPHYFQAHIVVVLTQLLHKSILRSADYIGRVAKWGTILGAFDIKYMPRTSIKGPFYCGDHFCLRPSVALVIDFGSESHVEGKPPHLLPYKL